MMHSRRIHVKIAHIFIAIRRIVTLEFSSHNTVLLSAAFKSSVVSCYSGFSLLSKGVCKWVNVIVIREDLR
jgi:hypothetical protein